MFMFVLDSTPKFEIVNFPCGPSSGTNKNLHTHRLCSSVNLHQRRGAAAAAARPLSVVLDISHYYEIFRGDGGNIFR